MPQKSPNDPDSENENEDPLHNVDDEIDFDGHEAEDNFQLALKEKGTTHESFFRRLENEEGANDLPMLLEEDETESSDKQSTAPLASIEDFALKNDNSGTSDTLVIHKRDGIVLKNNEDNLFLNPNNISPILIGRPDDSIAKIDDEYDNFPTHETDNDFYKRKRNEEDSFDNISLLSTDSYAPFSSATKKQKLSRTGSIKGKIRRSISFAMKTPIGSMMKSKKGSADPNMSMCSMTSFESTFNESIKKPVKEKFRKIKDKIIGKKDTFSTPKNWKIPACENLESLKKSGIVKQTVKTPENKAENDSCVGFKTPLAPPPHSSISFSTPSSSSTMACEKRSKLTSKNTKSATITSASSIANKTKNTGEQPPLSIDVVDEHNGHQQDLLSKRKIASPLGKQSMCNLNTTANHFNDSNVCPGAEIMPVFLLNFIYKFDF